MKLMLWRLALDTSQTSISTGSKTATRAIVLDGNYEHFFYLTNDYHGEILLRLLCCPDKTAELDRILMQGFREREPTWHIENDAVDSDGEPVLFGYFFDLPRIVRFRTALELQGKSGTVICFDFQSETLYRFFGPLVRYQTIDFTKFERRFFP